MAETSNISKIAEILANELFARFLWHDTGGWNQNWSCVKDDHTVKKRRSKVPSTSAGQQPVAEEENTQNSSEAAAEDAQVQQILTHPSDVVFYYDEPYSVSRTYVNTDLKSYKKGSISYRAVATAIENLALTLECAELSDEWREKFVHESQPYRIIGLLFIYNHDGEYDLGFQELLEKVNHDNLKIPRNSRIFVLGPGDIRWLDNVRYDIVSLRGLGRLPISEDKCSFFYPDLVRRKKVQPSARAATLELLTGPWIILSYKTETADPAGHFIYFRGRGKHTEEFLYLLDHLLHYQMVTVGRKINIRLFDADPNAPAHFKRAVDEYTENYDGDNSELATLLRSIEFDVIPQVRSNFSEVKIGMSRA